MKQSGIGMVAPFEFFVWDSGKRKLAIKLPPKEIENPLLLYIEFEKKTERYYLGEEKAVRLIAENPGLLPKQKTKC